MNYRRFQSRPAPPLRASPGAPGCLRASSRAFTLVEVMLSLLIAMILLYGMNRVFSDTSNAIRAGTALSEATRNGRAAQPVLFNDLNNCAPDSPAFIISSQIVPQYLNPADATANGNVQPVPGIGCELGDHMHRADQVMFFARGLYKRKTADNGLLVSTTTSNEAYVHYGHLRILGDGITPVGPGDPAVKPPTASEWVLGRNAILLADQNYVLLPNDRDLLNRQEAFYPHQDPSYPAPYNNMPPIWNAATNLTPLGWNSADSLRSQQFVQSSRYDLAGGTIDQFRSIITNAAQLGALPGNQRFAWWTPLVYTQPYANYTAITPPMILPTYTQPVSPLPIQYYNRFQGSNVLSPTPMTSQDQSNLAPYMLEHVSQFIVEYAGDFLTEDGNGTVTDTVPDGQIDWLYATKGQWNLTASYIPGDYVLIGAGPVFTFWQAVTPVVGASPANPNWIPIPQKNVPRRIRWYGMPRDETGSGHVYALALTNISNNLLANVVPLDEIWRTSAFNSGRPLPYEVELPRQALPLVAIADYASPIAGMNVASRYTAVWRNNVPAMVRILMKVDDPTSALQDGPWFEYVFKLK